MSKGNPKRLMLLRALGVILAIPLIGLIAVFVTLQIPAGRDTIAKRISAAVTSATDGQLSIENLQFTPFLDVSADSINFADAGGKVLQVSQVELDWRPLSLLRGIVDVNELHVAETALSRLPSTKSDETETTSPPFPSLPVDLRIRRIALERISVSPEITGGTAALSGQLRFALTRSGTFDATFDLGGADDTRTTLSGRAMLDDGAILEAEALLRDNSGGLLSSLLKLPDLPATRFKITGKGPVRSWRGDIDGGIGDLVRVGGTITGDLAGQIGTNLSLTADIDRAAYSTFGLPSLAASRITFDGRLDEKRRIGVRRLEVGLGNSVVHAAGRLSPADGSLDLQLTANLDGADVRPVLPAAQTFASAELKAGIGGLFARPRIEAELVVSDIAASQDWTVAEGRCRTVISLVDDLRTAQGEAACDASGVRGNQALEGLLGDTVHFDIAGFVTPSSRQVRIDRLALSGAGLRVGGKAEIVLAEARSLPRIQAEAKLDLTNPDAAQSVFGIPVRGTALLHLQPATTDKDEIAGTLGLTIRPVFVANDAMARFVGEQVGFESQYRIDPSGSLEISEATLSAPHAAAEGRATLNLDDWKLSVQSRLKLKALSHLTPAALAKVSDEATIDMVVHGEPSDLSVAGSFAGPTVERAPFSLRQVAGSYEFALAQSELAGRLAVTAQLNDAPAAADFDVALRDGTRLHLERIDIKALGASLAGNISGEVDLKRWQSELAFSVGDWAPLSDLAGWRLSGSASGTASCRTDGDEQACTLSATASGIEARTPDRTIRNELLTVETELHDLFGTPKLTAILENNSLTTAGIALDTAKLSLAGPVRNIAFAADLRGAAGARFALNSGGQMLLPEDGVHLTIASLEGTAADTEIRLVAPAVLKIAADKIDLAETRLRFGPGEFIAEAHRAPSGLRAAMTATAFPLAPFAALAAAPAADGALDGKAVLRWTAESQSLDASASVSGVRLAHVGRELPAGALSATARWDGATLSFDGQVSGFSGEPGRLIGTIPLRAGDRPLRFAVPKDRELAATFAWKQEIAPFMALLPLSEHDLRGVATVDLRAGGTLDNPRVAGMLGLTGGQYEHLYWGTTLGQINLQTEGESDGPLLLRIDAEDGGAGRLEGRGSAQLIAPGGPQGEFRLTIDTMTAVRRDDLQAVVSADLRASGDLVQTRVEGSIRVERMDVQIPERLPASVVDLNPREIGAGVAKAEAPGDRHGPVTRLDLTIVIPNRAFIRGRGLDSEWAGELGITGTSREPIIVGSLRTVRGSFTFAGRRFAISRGSLDFSGGATVDPEIDVVIDHSRKDFSAQIRLAGALSTPRLILTSSPQLPDDEILSQLVFGKTVSELNPGQALQIAESIAQITGVLPSGGGLMSNVRGLLGVDILTVEGDSENGPQLGIGKYVRDNVYLGVKQGVTPGSTVLSTEIELTPNINLSSEFGQNTVGNVGIDWRVDY